VQYAAYLQQLQFHLLDSVYVVADVPVNVEDILNISIKEVMHVDVSV
jgi:hypothetical protein